MPWGGSPSLSLYVPSCHAWPQRTWQWTISNSSFLVKGEVLLVASEVTDGVQMALCWTGVVCVSKGCGAQGKWSSYTKAGELADKGVAGGSIVHPDIAQRIQETIVMTVIWRKSQSKTMWVGKWSHLCHTPKPAKWYMVISTRNLKWLQIWGSGGCKSRDQYDCHWSGYQIELCKFMDMVWIWLVPIDKMVTGHNLPPLAWHDLPDCLTWWWPHLL